MGEEKITIDDILKNKGIDINNNKPKYKILGLHNFRQIRKLDPLMACHKGFIAGGCFKNILSNESYKDVDIFFRNLGDFEDANKMYQDYVDDCNNDEWVKSYENERVIAYKNTKTNIRVELIRTIFGTPEEILRQFDFTVVKMAYYKEITEDEYGEETIRYNILAHEDYFEHLHMKRLVIDENIPFPLSTHNRTYRYAKYGYFLCKESTVKLLKCISTLSEDDIDESTGFYEANGWD